jgi:hypothetical protein
LRVLACPSVVQRQLSARGSASLISLIPDEVLSLYDGYSLQDIVLRIVDTANDARIESLDYYALVKDAAEIAPDHCNGKGVSSVLLVQVITAAHYASIC